MRSSPRGQGVQGQRGPIRASCLALVGTLGVLALVGCGGKSNGSSTGAGATSGSGGAAGGGAGSDAGGPAGTDAGVGAEAGSDAGPDAPSTPTTTLYLVGDSTVAAFNDPYYYPRYGY